MRKFRFNRAIVVSAVVSFAVVLGVSFPFWAATAEAPNSHTRTAASNEVDPATEPPGGLSDAGGDTSSQDDGMLPPDVVSQKYKDAYRNFEADFPDGVKLPDIDQQLKKFEGMATADGAVGSSFEDGFAESQLVTNWQCAWERKYVDAHTSGNESMRDRAAGQLKGFYDLDATKRWYEDPDHSWYKHVVEPAVSGGDVRPMLDDLKNNCGAPFTLN